MVNDLRELLSGNVASPPTTTSTSGQSSPVAAAVRAAAASRPSAVRPSPRPRWS